MGIYTMNVDLLWTLATGSPGTNSWEFRATNSGGGGDGDDLDQAAAKLATFYGAIKQLFPNKLTARFLGEWRPLDAAAESQGMHVSTPWSVTGSSGANFLPPANQILLRRGSPQGGRSGRGHVFLGPTIVDAVDDDGRLIASDNSLIVNAANALLSPGGSDGSFVVWSRKSQVGRDVTVFTVSSEFAVLRSRRD